MTASERFAAYLAGKPVDRVPVVEWAPWWPLTVERWLGEGLPPEYAPVNMLQEYYGLDKCIWTMITCRTAQTPEPPEYGAGIMEDEKDYERLKPTLFPEPSSVLSEQMYEWIQSTHDRGDYLHYLSAEGFFWYPRNMFGIENHLYSFYDYPELYKRMCDEYTDWLEEVFKYILSRFHFDYVSFNEDMSYNSGPMISKEQFDEFLAPYYRRLIPLIHSYGIPVFVDSDGDITMAVDWYASVGVDGMYPLERQAGADVATYIQKQPQMAFLGHFDKMCMKHGEEAMRAEFERILPSMQKGKVIPATDHQTPPDVSMENYKIYARLLKEYAAKVTHNAGNITPCPVFKK